MTPKIEIDGKKWNPPISLLQTVVARVFPQADIETFEIYTPGAFNQNAEITLSPPYQVINLRRYTGPDAHHNCLNEETAYQLVRQYTDVPVPETLFFDPDGQFDGYPITLQTHLSGIPFSRTLSSMNKTNQRQLAFQAGYRIGQIHSIPCSPFGSLIRNDQQYSSWRALFSQRVQTDTSWCIDQGVLTPKVVSRILPVLDYFNGKECIKPELVHDDLHPSNILAGEHDGKPSITGVIDFEHAFAGAGAYDFAKLEWSLFRPYPHLRTPFFAGYKQTHPQVPQLDSKTHKIYRVAEIMHFLPFGAIRHMDEQIEYNTGLIEQLIAEIYE